MPIWARLDVGVFLTFRLHLSLVPVAPARDPFLATNHHHRQRQAQPCRVWGARASSSASTSKLAHIPGWSVITRYSRSHRKSTFLIGVFTGLVLGLGSITSVFFLAERRERRRRRRKLRSYGLDEEDEEERRRRELRGRDPIQIRSGQVVRGVEGLIGNTPLMRINSLSDATGCEILGKAEFLNPAGRPRTAWRCRSCAMQRTRGCCTRTRAAASSRARWGARASRSPRSRAQRDTAAALSSRRRGEGKGGAAHQARCRDPVGAAEGHCGSAPLCQRGTRARRSVWRRRTHRTPPHGLRHLGICRLRRGPG